MGQTLENGVYLPSEGERNCYAGLKTNWEILDQKVADVTALQQAVAGALHREIVESLPTTDINPNTIYMILSGTSATENVYNEFMYVNNAWELIGTSATDLTNYYTKAEVDGKLLLKANDSDVVHKSGNETIAGEKTFSDTATFVSVNVEGIRWKSLSTQTVDLNDCYIPKVGAISGYYNATVNSGANISNKAANTAFTMISLTTRRVSASDYQVRQVFYGSGAKYIRTCTNGTWTAWVNEVDKYVTTDTAQTISGDKTFSSINGVEPSSLSLPVFPSQSSWIDISSYITDMTGAVANLYTPPANGYITFTATGSQVQIFSDYGLQSKFSIQSGSTIRGYHPVLKNEAIKIYMIGTSIEFFRFIPCQGNV